MSLRIVFMGTPAFAVSSLDKLFKAGFDIAAVITAPDKPAGRGMKLTKSAVKEYAEANGIPVLQPEKLKNQEFVEELKNLKADVQVVVAFRMLPEIVWNMPPLGTINLHGSLLPQYRGAAPINWAIINGEKETGVTTFKLKHEIDTGNILLQEKISINETDNAGILHDKMMETGAELLVKTMWALEKGTLEEIKQKTIIGQNEELKHAPKLFTETCEIDWAHSVDSVYNLIRGLSPYPAAFTFLDDKKLKIFRAEKELFPSDTGSDDESPFLTDHRTYLKFRAADGYILLKEIQIEGKRKMNIEDFLRGWRGSSL
ncbi:MAG: methionyl-tRNA formyltransferase [Ginsengibacter sp.]